MKTKLAGMAFTLLLCASPALPAHADSVHIGMNAAWKDVLGRCDALNHDGEVALATGDFATAEADFRAAMAAMKETFGMAFPLHAYGLARTLTAEGRVAEAISTYRASILESSPPGGAGGQNDVMARLRLALLLNQTGQWAEAVANLKRALPALPGGGLPPMPAPFDPNVPQPTALAAVAHMALGLEMNWTADYRGDEDTAGALQEYGKSLQIAPDSDLANFYYGYGLQRAGQVTQARAAFTKTIKMARGDVKVAAEQALKKMKKLA